jgi:hypothetical protein
MLKQTILKIIASASLWIGASFLLTGTFLLQFPSTASTSVIPWIFFLIGNGVWTIDSYLSNRKEWLVVGVAYTLLNAYILCTRIFASFV